MQNEKPQTKEEREALRIKLSMQQQEIRRLTEAREIRELAENTQDLLDRIRSYPKPVQKRLAEMARQATPPIWQDKVSANATFENSRVLLAYAKEVMNDFPEARRAGYTVPDDVRKLHKDWRNEIRTVKELPF